MSNPTYLLYSGRAPGNKFVVRKKPPGDGLKGAHQVDREYRIMHALKDTAVCVPRVFHYCTREDVVGKEFYVMEYVSGRVEEKNEGRRPIPPPPPPPHTHTHTPQLRDPCGPCDHMFGPRPSAATAPLGASLGAGQRLPR